LINFYANLSRVGDSALLAISNYRLKNYAIF
jgi:hypothetical protein